MNNAQKAIAELIRLSTTKKFPGNLIVDDLEANEELWHSFYATLHNCTIPGTFSIYDPEAYNVAAENLRQLGIGKMEYNKLCIYPTGANNGLLKQMAKTNWNADFQESQSGLIRKDGSYIQILIIKWYLK